jgi:hypothetical protein
MSTSVRGSTFAEKATVLHNRVQRLVGLLTAGRTVQRNGGEFCCRIVLCDVASTSAKE